ncbi:MAG TPA: response regulator [Ideonella sp.]|nr:response regulator [Ideonella sp.]
MADKGTILVVDDDRLVLATVTHGLAEAGYTVIDADNGDEAILLARERRPDLALLDIRMEGKSGFDVAAVLREKLGIPFVFLSAFADEATAAQVRALGALAWLVKPLDIGQIVPAVEAALAQGRPVRAATPHAPDAAPTLQPLSLAVGVLMHRYSLDRASALERLVRLAAEEGLTPEAQAARLVDALELLARAPR